MVYIMTTTWYPPESQDEVLKKFLVVDQKFPMPDYEKEIVRMAVWVDEDGIKIISIAEVEKGKLQEALNHTHKVASEYWGIEGFRYKVQTLFSGTEAFAVIGRTLPKR